MKIYNLCFHELLTYTNVLLNKYIYHLRLIIHMKENRIVIIALNILLYYKIVNYLAYLIIIIVINY